MIDIDVRCEGASLLIQTLTDAPEKAKRAISMSVNKIARSARTQMAREASQRYLSLLAMQGKRFPSRKQAAMV